MNHETIIIENAHMHNLKNITLDIPKHKLVAFTGVSGSGKSTLLFDTIYTEAQRQLIETFSTFARARMPKLSRPDVDDIRNLSTAIVIDQKRMGTNLRSTVGTATEINTYLRLLYSRLGTPYIGASFLFSFNHPDGMCQHCHGLGKIIRINTDMLLDKNKSIFEGAITHPDFKIGGWLWRELVSIDLFDINKKIENYTTGELNRLLYSEPIPIDKKHGVSTYSKNFEGIARRMERLITGKAEDESPDEEKDAYRKFHIYSECPHCTGTRLNERARSVKLNNITIAQLCSMELSDVDLFLQKIDCEIGRPIIDKIRQILNHLIDIGVGYLSLDRAVATLSGGESQRVKMARQLDCNLVDMIYVLDEPSIGLHPRDTAKLITILKKLRDNGNSVFVVEHDPEIIRSAEWLIDIGPKAGRFGGELVYTGEPEGIVNTESLTGKYLFNEKHIILKRKKCDKFIEIKNATRNNLKNVSAKFPVGALTCVTGVAGSGKSTLIHQCFIKKYPESIVIDQSAIGKTSRANPATYTGIFDMIRKEFATATGEPAALFSFNSQGACPKCNGQGSISYELHFLDSVRTTCDECQGKRYQQEVLQLHYNDKSIADILDMSVNQAIGFFKNSRIDKQLKILSEVGLDYIKLGQSLSTLSGGESQRLKIASELSKEGNIYIMDEPTTGLHMSDIAKLYDIINTLVQKNNTVIVIEHNLDIIKYADWIIDMGPEGGKNGGEIIFQGYPEDLIKSPASYTGKYLKNVL